MAKQLAVARRRFRRKELKGEAKLAGGIRTAQLHSIKTKGRKSLHLAASRPNHAGRVAGTMQNSHNDDTANAWLKVHYEGIYSKRSHARNKIATRRAHRGRVCEMFARRLNPLDEFDRGNRPIAADTIENLFEVSQREF